MIKQELIAEIKEWGVTGWAQQMQAMLTKPEVFALSYGITREQLIKDVTGAIKDVASGKVKIPTAYRY